jgi:hypothetical protein
MIIANMIKKKRRIAVICTAIFLTPFFQIAFAQIDLLDGLEDEKGPVYTKATFKTSRIINGHSIENPAAGVLDFRISHRFNTIENGAYDLFGLDGATLRLGFEYGVNDRLMIGLGRSTYQKAYDGFLKYKVLRQQTGRKNIPFSVSLFSSTAVSTLKWQYPDRKNYFSSRMAYSHQLLIARKFSSSTSIQLTPTLVHYNLVQKKEYKHDVFAIGIGGRQKLSKRVSFNAEYFFVLPNQINKENTNSLSFGFDIETGGHVFQLLFTNSMAMIEKGFIGETKGDWLKGRIRFGFNLSRVFTLVDKKE